MMFSPLKYKYQSISSDGLGKYTIDPTENKVDEKFFTENIIIFAAFIYILLIAAGTAFYYNADHWDLRTSYFYAAQTLICIGYGAIEEWNDSSFAFSVVYTIIGATIVAATVGYSYTSILFQSEENKRLKGLQEFRLNKKDDTASSYSSIGPYREYVEDHWPMVALIFSFIILIISGIYFAYVYEEFDIWKSVYFVFSGLSGTGNIAPKCTGGDRTSCSVVYGYFWGTYILISRPIFDGLIGAVAFLAVRIYIESKQKDLLLQPWEFSEFQYAKEICLLPYISENTEAIMTKEMQMHDLICDNDAANQPRMTFAEFLLVELARIGHLDQDLINNVKEIFEAKDVEKKGTLSVRDLKTVVRTNYSTLEEECNCI